MIDTIHVGFALLFGALAWLCVMNAIGTIADCWKSDKLFVVTMTPLFLIMAGVCGKLAFALLDGDFL